MMVISYQKGVRYLRLNGMPSLSTGFIFSVLLKLIIRGLTRNENIFPDPEAFKPERWLEPSYPTYKEPLTQYPMIKNHSGFGWGRRTCVGQDYSESVILTIVAGILWSCTITKKRDPETGLEIQPPWLDYGSFAIVCPEPYELDIKPRDSSRIDLLKAQI